jgi:hypothetical protein
MKRCPTCNRTYADLSLNFCLDDGTPLTSDAAPTTDLNATLRYPPPRDTAGEPPPTEIYRPAPAAPPPRPTAPPSPPPAPQQWTPSPQPQPKRSNAIWWILGVFFVVLVVGAGLAAVFIALSLSSNSNTSVNVNSRDTNRNANANVNANSNTANANANVGPAAALFDDFSEKKWGTGTSAYGKTFYANDEYHMSSKERSFVVMYAPSNDYSTENSTVKVTARSVDGSVPSAGFGLMVHGVQPKPGQLEDYALLIYPSAEPEYEIIMHKQGAQSTLVERTKSSAIRSGSTPNELEVRIKGNELSFYINGQFLKTITDRENFRNGRAGFYTSDVTEVAFDDLHIDRSR